MKPLASGDKYLLPRFSYICALRNSLHPRSLEFDSTRRVLYIGHVDGVDIVDADTGDIYRTWTSPHPIMDIALVQGEPLQLAILFYSTNSYQAKLSIFS